jgi:hypothetical protein
MKQDLTIDAALVRIDQLRPALLSSDGCWTRSRSFLMPVFRIEALPGQRFTAPDEVSARGEHRLP